jgi:hypothetical protein
MAVGARFENQMAGHSLRHGVPIHVFLHGPRPVALLRGERASEFAAFLQDEMVADVGHAQWVSSLRPFKIRLTM